MSALSIENLLPEGAEFTLRVTGKSYRLRPMSIADELWMRRAFPDIEAVFKLMQMDAICRIVFKLMLDEDKLDFASREVTLMDDEGHTKKIQTGGVELLLLMVSGVKEKLSIYEALLKTIGLSQPVLEKLVEAEKEKKSKTASIGPQSSTDSLTNTDGQPSIS